MKQVVRHSIMIVCLAGSPTLVSAEPLQRVNPGDAQLDCTGLAAQQQAMAEFITAGDSNAPSIGKAAAGGAANVGGQVAGAAVAQGSGLFGGLGGLVGKVAGVVAQRYREGELRARTDLGTPAYLTGLLLRGRRAVAVGGGCVNRRRVPQLLAAGADVTVIAPDLHPALAELAARGRVTWERRGYEASDLDGAWFVLAATDSPALNASIAADAEARHTFCVRADRGASGSAWTPATATLGRSTVAVLSEGDPGRSKAVRDRIVQQWEATQ